MFRGASSTACNIFGMRSLAAALVCAALLPACAPKIVPPPVVTTPKYPEFVRPTVPSAFEGTPAAINLTRGWAFLQAGELKTAEHELTAALTNDPGFFPAETSLGYVELARKDPRAALPHFDRTLERQRDDFAALMGRGQALLALNRESDALGAFESALALDPSQAELRRRVDVLKFRGVEQSIARARDAARSGRLEEAAQAYAAAVASSPDSPFLYREFGLVERQQGRMDAALEHFEKAVALDSSDARSLIQIGEILAVRDDLEGAIRAYSDAAAVEPSDQIEKKLEELRARVAYAKLPAEYRAIEQAPQVTRADLAALIGIRLAPLLEGGQRADAALITDVRNSWAQTWIMSVARAGIMEPFANHAFQPRAVVRRAELAQVAARLLTRIGARSAGTARAWENARLVFPDLAPTHLAYPAASIAVAAGVMKTRADNTFQPSRPITGAEAVEAAAKLESLAGLK